MVVSKQTPQKLTPGHLLTRELTSMLTDNARGILMASRLIVHHHLSHVPTDSDRSCPLQGSLRNDGKENR